jgi:hypothetical protein
MSKRTMRGCTWPFAMAVGLLTALPASLAVAQDPSAESSATAVPCAALAADPAHGLAGNPVIKTARSTIVPATGPNLAHCQVNVLYGATPEQNINIRVGLPLNALDGGSGGVQGAWNGRTQGIGGGGCAGNVNVTAPVNAGYVGSGTDTGHVGGDCEPGVNDDGTYNLEFIQDFIRNAIKQQVLLSKAVTREYYGMAPAYNYWNGCSTGGRQGYLLAQELPRELDGILANAPAIFWTRFQTAQMWGQIVMKELVGGPIDPAKLSQTTASAVAACDAADGVIDGLLDDPRTCHFSAAANICGAATAPATNCLTPQEAQAIDLIWDGPRNRHGERIWFGLDRGTNLSGLNGPTPFALGVTQLHWDEHDRTFDWQTATVDEYPRIAQDGSRNIADVTDTFGPLDAFRRQGGKLLTFVGGNDQLIMPRGVIHYYRQIAANAARRGHEPDFDSVQTFYRLFRAPGVGHCGGGSGPQPQGLFDALVNWVELGVAPQQILAQSATGAVTRTRPLCPYPRTAIYNGSGSSDDAASFHCGGNLETPEVVCADVPARYKHEVRGPLAYAGSGVNPRICAAAAHRP